MTVQCGYIQFRPELGETDKNMARIESLLHHADGAQLLVLPELSNSGYQFVSREEAEAFSEEIPGGPFSSFLIQWARGHRQYIVAGINERSDSRLFNTAILVGPDGMVGKYRKMHLFWDEVDLFDPGDIALTVFNLPFARLGMLICFDWMFPEVWRILALKGADIICHPSNLVLPFAQQAVPVHGLVNRVFIITANRTGTERGLKFSGCSFISDPLGRTLHTASREEDEVYFTGLDTDRARYKMITPRNHAFKDRRPDQYTLLVSDAVDKPS
ncbi:MAG: hypothetical protein JW861_04660 [Bacteroidales bacterium]|nr:hypothetical protein [Bacteroidales bacterium]